MKRNVCRLLLILGLFGPLMEASWAQANLQASPLVKSWLAAQAGLNTWSADLFQTRTFKSLAVPLTNTGRVWFEAPARFRWELGHPPQTIAVRAPEELLIFYPRFKRVERYPLTGEQTGPWRDAMTLLEAGFPRSEAQLISAYNILSQSVADGYCALILQPKSETGRRMIPQVEIDFDMNTLVLRGTQLEFADGSTMRNDFNHVVLNPKLNQSLFSPSIPADDTVVEPLENH